MRTILKILMAIAVFSLMIAAHEVGHCVGAALVGIPIKAFSIGFGPELWGMTVRGIHFALRLLPLGGYVEMDPAIVEAASRPAQLILTLAGPLFGFAVTMLVALVFARKSLGKLLGMFASNAIMFYYLALTPVRTLVGRLRPPKAPLETEPDELYGVEPTPPNKPEQGSGIMGPIGILKGFASGDIVFILGVSAAINGMNLGPIPIFDGAKALTLVLLMLGVSAKTAATIPPIVTIAGIFFLFSSSRKR